MPARPGRATAPWSIASATVDSASGRTVHGRRLQLAAVVVEAVWGVEWWRAVSGAIWRGRWRRDSRSEDRGSRMRANNLTRSSTPRSSPLVVFDEFTSVVDRTVAKVCSAAIAKAIRRGQHSVPIRGGDVPLRRGRLAGAGLGGGHVDVRTHAEVSSARERAVGTTSDRAGDPPLPRGMRGNCLSVITI